MQRKQLEREAIAAFIRERVRDGDGLYLARGGVWYRVLGYDHERDKFKVERVYIEGQHGKSVDNL